MIIPTLKIEHHKRVGADVYGQAKVERQRDQMVCPVRLSFGQQHSTVRTDSAASHGGAMEMVPTCIVLVKPNADVGVDDMLVVLGNKVRVMEVHPRYTVRGKLDHKQVLCTAWGEGA